MYRNSILFFDSTIILINFFCIASFIKSNILQNKHLQLNVVSMDDNQSEAVKQLMKGKIKELITNIDKQVLTVSESQSELDKQLDKFITTLDNIKIDEKLTDEICANTKRISSLKSRLTVIHTILSNSSARCSNTLTACQAAVSSLNQ